jgi:signal recognition particle subunit SRP54
MLAACDIYRPAAIKQLQVVGEKVARRCLKKASRMVIDREAEAVERAQVWP